MNYEQKLRSFRAAYPEKAIDAAGVGWRYRVCGDSPRRLLLLPGGELVNDLQFDFVTHLASRFRVIYPAYPRPESLDGLLDGLVAILDAEDADRLTVIGMSFGGAVAQCLVRRCPERIERVVFSNCGVPQTEVVRPRRIVNATLSAMPWPILRKPMARSLLRLLNAPAGELCFWRGYVQDLYAKRLSKPDVLANLRLQLEFHAGQNFLPGDLADWPGDILIIQSDNDIFNADRRKMVRDVYSRAQVHTFQDAGHYPACSRAAEYRRVLDRFLE